MSSDFLKDKFSMAVGAKKAGVSVQTYWRWALYGVRGVKLETWLIGGRRYCCEEAHARFFERLNSRPRQAESSSLPLVSKAAAEKILDEAGI